MHQKLIAGAPFPPLTLPRLNRGTIALGQAADWEMLVVYRGLHCPLCKTYAQLLDGLLDGFAKQGVSVVLASGDNQEKAKTFVHETNYSGVVAYDMTVAQMQALGLYISNPRSPSETDKPFAEPGLFVINAEKHVQILDVSNAPFARPDLGGILRGITFIRGNPDYPVRGTYA